MSLSKNIRALVRNPAMRAAYIRWLVSRVALARPPKLKLSESVSLGGWLSFSEFWSFHDSVPEAERLFMRRCMESCRRPVVAFDVGANIGAFTCLLPSLGADEVHAFEPIPETFCRLKANVAANRLPKRCHLNCLAVGKGSELVTFSVQGHSSAENQLVVPEDSARKRSPEGLQRVATTSLDSYCQATGVERIDCLKVDVEGMEPYVLQGAHDLLAERSVGAILIEVCPVNLRQVGFTPLSLFQEFTRAGYAPHEISANGNPGRRLDLKDVEAIVLGNVALMPT